MVAVVGVVLDRVGRVNAPASSELWDAKRRGSRALWSQVGGWAGSGAGAGVVDVGVVNGSGTGAGAGREVERWRGREG